MRSPPRHRALGNQYAVQHQTHVYHPHLHVIATSGGYDAQTESWAHLHFLPYDVLRHKWQWHLMTMLRRTLASDAIEDLVDVCYRKYPNGLVSRVQRGKVPAQYQSLARSRRRTECARQVWLVGKGGTRDRLEIRVRNPTGESPVPLTSSQRAGSESCAVLGRPAL